MPRARTPVRCRRRKPRRRKPAGTSVFRKRRPWAPLFVWRGDISCRASSGERDSGRGAVDEDCAWDRAGAVDVAGLRRDAGRARCLSRQQRDGLPQLPHAARAAGPRSSRALAGGSQVFDEPAFKVTGSNITPDKDTGIGNWSDAELKRFLVSGHRPNGTKVAPIMPTAFYTVLTARISMRLPLTCAQYPQCATKRRRRNTGSR